MVSWISATLVVCTFSIFGSLLGQSRTAAAKQPQPQAAAHAPDGWDRPVANSAKEQPGPAPRHDISGT
ncbi:MAG: alpha/beta hydrolase [Acidobacteria bacterium]|nr:MAG: alpha/beta hydrolase [Acidobacteriota bacterium]